MTFRDRVQSISGLRILLPGGTGRILAYYAESQRVLISLDEGTEYEVGMGYMTMHMTSDGHDQIILDISELEKLNG